MRWLAVCLFFVLFSFFGCRKIATMAPGGGPSDMEMAIRNFINAEIKNKPKWAVNNIKDMLEKLDFSTIRKTHIKYNSEVIELEINNINVHDFTVIKKETVTSKVNSEKKAISAGENAVTKVLFFVNNEKITDGSIVEVSSTIHSQKELESSFIDIIYAKKRDFTGHVNINNIWEKLCNDWEYNNGHVLSSTVVGKGRNPIASGNTRTTSQTCFDWYLITTYFYTDGNTTQDSVYLGRTCSGAPDDVQVPQIDFNGGDPEAPDTSCAQTKRIANDTAFSNKVLELRDSAGNIGEIGYALMKNSTSYSSTKLTPVSNSALSLNGLTSTIDIIVHNHVAGQFNTFTLDDLVAMYDLYRLSKMTNPSTFCLAMVSFDGSVQMIKITDISAYSAWANQNLSNPTNNQFTTIYSQNVTLSNSFTANRINILNLLQNSGLTLFEGHTSALAEGFQRLEYIPATESNSAGFARKKCSN